MRLGHLTVPYGPLTSFKRVILLPKRREEVASLAFLLLNFRNFFSSQILPESGYANHT